MPEHVREVWWRQANVYQVYPRSFADGNGDGLGDLVGVTAHLDYLTALGVDAIWLSPFYPSPLHDSGYDVRDPCAVDPMFGTLEDFATLVEQAHLRGIRVIVDTVPNHVSSEHAWFVEALGSEPGSAARDRFHMRTGRGSDGSEPPTNWLSMFGGPAWTRIDGTDQWYLHLFDPSQPDLNWSNDEVRRSWLDVLRFWLDRGVDGFRVDVALGLAKDMSYPDVDDPAGLIEGLRLDLDDGSPRVAQLRERVANSPMFDRDELVDIYAEWRAVLDAYPGDRMAVAEAWVTPERMGRYVSPTALHQIFGFDFLTAPWSAEALRDRIERTQRAVGAVGALPTWALSNHDTPRVVSRLGDGAIGLQRARALALVAHCLPGSVYVYQGEELGLADAPLTLDERQDPIVRRTDGAQLGRDGGRVPLPWSGAQPPFGFTTSDAPLWLPQPAEWAARTASIQERDGASVLHQYRTTLWLRRVHPGLVDPSVCTVELVTSGHLRITRGAGFTCVLNTSDRAIGVSGTVLATSDPAAFDEVAGGLCPPDTAVWLQH